MNWFKNYSTENEELNRKQNEFINVIRDFKRTLSGDKDKANREVGNVIIFLVNYVSTYFPLEEAYLTEIGYEDLDEHIKMHRKFTTEVYRILHLLKNKKVFRPIQLHYLLSGWFSGHISTEDMKFLSEPELEKNKIKITSKQDIIHLVTRGFNPIDHKHSHGQINDKVREDKRLAHFKKVVDSIDRNNDGVDSILKQSITELFDMGTIVDLEYKRMNSYLSQ